MIGILLSFIKNIFFNSEKVKPLTVTELLQMKASESEVLQYINNHPRCYNEVDKDGQTVLMHAIQRNYKSVLFVVLRRGADIHAFDKEGWSALMYAACYGNLSMVSKLLACGADISKKSMGDGRSALHIACGHERIDIALYLLEGGASYTSKDNWGRTAGQYLKYKENIRKYCECIEHLGGQFKHSEFDNMEPKRNSLGADALLNPTRSLSDLAPSPGSRAFRYFAHTC